MKPYLPLPLFLLILLLGCGRNPLDSDKHMNWGMAPLAFEYPRFLPNGERVVFYRRKITKVIHSGMDWGYAWDPDSTGIWSAKADGTDFQMIRKCNDLGGLDVSPDGRWLIYSEAPSYGLVLTDMIGDSTFAFRDGSNFFKPEWRRDGTYICNDSGPGGDPSYALWINRTDGTKYFYLRDSTGVVTTATQGGDPTWLGSEDTVLFHAYAGVGRIGIYSKSIWSNTKTLLYSIDSETGTLRDLSASPNAEFLAFRQGNIIRIVDLKDFNHPISFAQEFGEEPSWSPDGNTLVYVAPDESDPDAEVKVLWTMARDGSQRIQVTH